PQRAYGSGDGLSWGTAWDRPAPGRGFAGTRGARADGGAVFRALARSQSAVDASGGISWLGAVGGSDRLGVSGRRGVRVLRSVTQSESPGECSEVVRCHDDRNTDPFQPGNCQRFVDSG